MSKRILWFFLGLTFAVPALAQSVEGPDALAKRVTDEVIAIVRTDKDIQAGNTKKVLDLVEAKVLPHFNFTRMTRLALRVCSTLHWKRLLRIPVASWPTIYDV